MISLQAVKSDGAPASSFRASPLLYIEKAAFKRLSVLPIEDIPVLRVVKARCFHRTTRYAIVRRCRVLYLAKQTMRLLYVFRSIQGKPLCSGSPP